MLRDMVLHHISRRANSVRPNYWYAGAHSGSLRAAYGGCSLDAHCGGCVRPCEITSQTAIYRYKRSVLVDFIIERPLFPSDWACACRDWLLPPMVALPHACLPVRWWIRFAAAKPRRLKRATGTFLRAGFRIRHLPSAKAKKTFLLECLFALVEGGGFEPPKS